jgi:hypothetical protein
MKRALYDVTRSLPRRKFTYFGIAPRPVIDDRRATVQERRNTAAARR